MKARNYMSMTVAAAALIALNMPITAFAEMKEMSIKEHREGHGPMMEMAHMAKMGEMMDMCVEHSEMLGLSDAQINKMKPVHRDMQKKQARFEADVKIAEIELSEIMEVKDFDLVKATAAVKKIADFKTNQQLELLKAMKDVRAIWTEEQFNKMKKMMPMKKGENKHPKKMKHNVPKK